MSFDGALGVTAGSASIDRDAIVAELFDREATSLVRLARCFCDDREAAEDLVQEAFIRLHRAAGTIREPARAPAFLRSIVINLARDHNRRGLMSLRHQPSMTTPAVARGFEEEAVVAEDDRAVFAAVRGLPDRQRACLVLRYYLELTETETADTLGISQSSVKTHCRRGLAALSDLLEGIR